MNDRDITVSEESYDSWTVRGQVEIMQRQVAKAFSLLKFNLFRRFQGYDVPHEPHFDEISTEWFRASLAKATSYLEYGSGGSTLLADRLDKPTFSVENDKWFAAAVRKQLKAKSGVDLQVVHLGATGPWGVPVFAKPTPSRIKRWRRYVAAPFDSSVVSARFPDLVLVDGRFRQACALEVTRQAQGRGATTTIMFDDYYLEGKRGYSGVEKWLGAPERIGRAAVFRTSNAREVPEEAVTTALRSFH